MTESVKKNSAGGASAKSNKGTRATELDAIADTLMERQCEYLVPRFALLHEMGKGTEDKLNAIQSDLASLSASTGVVKADISEATLIFNVLRYTTRQAILRAAKKEKVRFAADYSNHTVRRRQAFTQAMDTAQERGVEFSFLSGNPEGQIWCRLSCLQQPQRSRGFSQLPTDDNAGEVPAGSG